MESDYYIVCVPLLTQCFKVDVYHIMPFSLVA